MLPPGVYFLGLKKENSAEKGWSYGSEIFNVVLGHKNWVPPPLLPQGRVLVFKKCLESPEMARKLIRYFPRPPRHVRRINSDGIDGDQAEGQECTDPGARTPIGSLR